MKVKTRIAMHSQSGPPGRITSLMLLKKFRVAQLVMLLIIINQNQAYTVINNLN